MKIAICQFNPVVGDLAANVVKICAAFLEAEAGGSELLVTPELSATGYPLEDVASPLVRRKAGTLRMAPSVGLAIRMETKRHAASASWPANMAAFHFKTDGGGGELSVGGHQSAAIGAGNGKMEGVRSLQNRSQVSHPGPGALKMGRTHREHETRRMAEGVETMHYPSRRIPGYVPAPKISGGDRIKLQKSQIGNQHRQLAVKRPFRYRPPGGGCGGVFQKKREKNACVEISRPHHQEFLSSRSALREGVSSGLKGFVRCPSSMSSQVRPSSGVRSRIAGRSPSDGTIPSGHSSQGLRLAVMPMLSFTVMDISPLADKFQSPQSGQTLHVRRTATPTFIITFHPIRTRRGSALSPACPDFPRLCGRRGRKIDTRRGTGWFHGDHRRFRR